jgi:small-conductance mechanosensitive channel
MTGYEIGDVVDYIDKIIGGDIVDYEIRYPEARSVEGKVEAGPVAG